MSSAGVDRDATWWVRTARRIAFGIAFVAGLAVMVIVVRLAADGVQPWASWRAATRSDGFPVLAASAAWIVLGALFQAPVALMRRTGALWAAGAMAVLVLYYLVVVAGAVTLSPMASEIGGGRGSEDGSYAIILGVLLITPAVFALSGALFRRPLPGVRGWRVVCDDSFGGWNVAALICFIGALVGLAMEVLYQLGISLFLLLVVPPLVGPPLMKLYRWVRDIVRRLRRRRRRRRLAPGPVGADSAGLSHLDHEWRPPS